jgi:hypothetical protein
VASSCSDVASIVTAWHEKACCMGMMHEKSCCMGVVHEKFVLHGIIFVAWHEVCAIIGTPLEVRFLVGRVNIQLLKESHIAAR